MTNPHDTITRKAFVDLIDKTCDDVLAHTTGGEALTDLMNLIVNVMCERFDTADMDLRVAIERCYSTDPDEVLGWMP